MITNDQLIALSAEARQLRMKLDDLMCSDLALAILGSGEYSRQIEEIHHRLNDINELIAG